LGAEPVTELPSVLSTELYSVLATELSTVPAIEPTDTQRHRLTRPHRRRAQQR
jgi:hypothetical protein